jgi:hypothetical protein
MGKPSTVVHKKGGLIEWRSGPGELVTQMEFRFLNGKVGRRKKIVGIATTSYGLDDREVRSSSPGRGKMFLFLISHRQVIWPTNRYRGLFPCGGQAAETRSRKRGTIYPFPHTLSWRRAYLVKHRDNFTFYMETHSTCGAPYWATSIGRVSVITAIVLESDSFWNITCSLLTWSSKPRRKGERWFKIRMLCEIRQYKWLQSSGSGRWGKPAAMEHYCNMFRFFTHSQNFLTYSNTTRHVWFTRPSPLIVILCSY